MPDKPSNTIWKRAMRSLASGVGAGTFVLIAAPVFHQYDIGHTFRAIGFAVAGGCSAAFAGVLWRQIVKEDGNQP